MKPIGRHDSQESRFIWVTMEATRFQVKSSGKWTQNEINLQFNELEPFTFHFDSSELQIFHQQSNVAMIVEYPFSKKCRDVIPRSVLCRWNKCWFYVHVAKFDSPRTRPVIKKSKKFFFWEISCFSRLLFYNNISALQFTQFSLIKYYAMVNFIR